MKKVLILFLLVSVTVFSQNLNEYKYALIPAKFSFLKDSNMYNLNALTKMYMEKYGFETYLDNETYSNDFASTNCNKVFIDVFSNSNMFTTKLSVVIKDCKNNVLFISEEGKSNDKEFKVAYNLALRQAFDNFSVLKGHKFQPTEKSLGMIGEPSDVENHKENKFVKDEKALIKSNPVMEDNGIEIAESDLIISNLLVAETIKNGFLLIDSKTSTVVLKVYKTSDKNIFIAISNKINGVVIKKGKDNFIEYYKDNVLVTEKLNVCCL